MGRSAETHPQGRARKNYPDDVADAAVKDWHRFVLGELNGLGTMLRFDAEEGGERAPDISRRAREMVGTLSWDPATSCAQAWAFAEAALEEPADAWAPHLVLSTLGDDPDRLQTWVRGLPAEARAFIDGTKLH
jgi:hypothetical protein